MKVHAEGLPWRTGTASGTWYHDHDVVKGFSAEPSSAVTRSACHSAPMHHACCICCYGGSACMNSLWWQAGFTAT